MSRHASASGGRQQGRSLRGPESDSMTDLALKPTMTATPSTPTVTAAPALAQFDTLPDSAHVRLPVVAALLSVGPATVWRWAKTGRLCAPRKIGPNTTVWNVAELRRSMAAMAEA